MAESFIYFNLMIERILITQNGKSLTKIWFFSITTYDV